MTLLNVGLLTQLQFSYLCVVKLSLPREEDWDPEEFDSVVSVIPAFKFSIFLAVLETKLVTTLLYI